MPDTPPSPAADTGDFTPEQIAHARERWIGYGLDPAAFDRGLAGDVPQPDKTPRTTEPRGNADLSDAQVKRAVATLSRAGASPEQIREALIADGLMAEGDELPTLAPDTRTDEEKAFDRHFGPPDDLSRYQLNWRDINAGFKVDDAADLQRLDHGIREALHAMAIPAALGGSLITDAIKAADRFRDMTDVEKDTYYRVQRAELERMNENPDAIIASAKSVLDRLKVASPTVWKELIDYGLWKDAATVLQLGLHGARLAERGAIAPAKPGTKRAPVAAKLAAARALDWRR